MVDEILVLNRGNTRDTRTELFLYIYKYCFHSGFMPVSRSIFAIVEPTYETYILPGAILQQTILCNFDIKKFHHH
jgi:hypothetical protein